MYSSIIKGYHKNLHSPRVQASATREINTGTVQTKGRGRIGSAVIPARSSYGKAATKLSNIRRRIISKEASKRVAVKLSYVSDSIPRNEEEAWFLKYTYVLDKLRNLPENWDSYGAKSPNFTALYWSKTVLELLLEMNFPPDRVTPSVENGIGISFIRDKKYADIECFNTGEILAVISDRQGKPNVWEVGNDIESINLALERICVFIRN